MRDRHGSAGSVALGLVGLLVAGLVGVVITSELRGDDPFGRDRQDPSEWVTVFDEQFNGDVLDEDRWNTCHWWDDGGCTIESNEELQWYLPWQVEVADGTLRLTAEKQDVRTPSGERFGYSSGMVTTGPPAWREQARYEFTYGRVEARVRAPAGTGLWSAFWLLPSTSESRPEIDVLELLGNDPSEWIFHYHPVDRKRESDGFRVSGPDLSAGWHDVGLEWEPGSLRWFIDGRQVWSVAGDHVPSEPMYLVANLAVGGVYPGPPAEDTVFPATFEIDRITVWQRQG
jgi:beta-glucanase (GH16 family)